jgi:hypothetical protein
MRCVVEGTGDAENLILPQVKFTRFRQQLRSDLGIGGAVWLTLWAG